MINFEFLQNFVQNQFSDALWPTDLTTPFGYRTPSPIDIDTCETRIVNTTCPMQIVIGQYVPYQTINTGYSR